MRDARLAPELETAIQSLIGLYTPLKRAARTHWTRLAASQEDMELRRTTVKETCVFFEGTTNGLDDLVKAMRQNPPHGVARAPVGSGITKGRKFGVRVRRTFDAAAELFGRDPIDTKSPGWKDFLQSVRIRNRITHPRRSSALEIADDEIVAVNRALNWFHSTFMGLIRGPQPTRRPARIITFPDGTPLKRH